MTISVDAILDLIAQIFDFMRDVSVTVGGVSFSLLDFEIALILVDLIIYFVTTFTSRSDSDSDGG